MLDSGMINYLKEQTDIKYKFNNIDKLELLDILLKNIGVENPELRDGLVYPCLAHLLYDKHFDEETLKYVLNRLLDEEHLFFDLENSIKNSVLTRSFSSLQIVILLAVHKRDNIIPKEMILKTLELFLKYFEKETFYKGYDEHLGWLHSIAHSADVFSEFLTISYFEEEEITLIFEKILKKFKERNYYFSHDEDERMVVGIKAAIKRDILSKAYILDYIERLSTYEKNNKFPEMYIIKNNLRNLLRSLYFSLIEDKKYDFITAKIKQVLLEKVNLRDK